MAHDCKLHRIEVCEKDDGHLYMKLDMNTYMMSGPDMHPLEYCPICGMKGKASHIENLTLFDRNDDLKDRQLQHMHNLIMEIFMSSCHTLIEDDLDDHSYKFCEDTIQNTLIYVKMKRKEKKQ